MNTHGNKTERPAVVAVMGHIDHGKSTLLSYIRKNNKPLGEAGGITQHISAYEVEHVSEDGKKHEITFLDTPGHEAFSGIRTRGAKAADIAILVVSAEDGVKPQTLEAWKSITTTNTPFIVAINKIDKETANVEKTKQNLTENGIYLEGYGGDIPSVLISAKTGKGIPELLDMITLVSEIENFTGVRENNAEGIVIESNRDEKKGISATCIVQNGTLHKGMFIVSGTSMAPIRIMENCLGKHIDTATFSSPIVVIGWDSLPEVGSSFTSFTTREEARAEIAKPHTAKTHTKQEDIAGFRIPVIVKADTGGSLEALIFEIEKLTTDRVGAQVVLSGIGTISESDIARANGNVKAIVIGFHVDIDPSARNLAERNKIVVEKFDIIYKMSEWLAEILKKSTPKMEVEESTGMAKVLKTFSKTKDKQVLGCKVEKGVITIGSLVRIIRRDAEIGLGRVRELQEQKSKVTEVAEGHEFGTLVEAKIEIAIGDKIESFITIEK